MERVKTCIVSDGRTISGLFGPTGAWKIVVGYNADVITAYIEDGDTPWFAILKAGKIIERVNSRYVEIVTYDPPDSKEVNDA